MPRKNTQKWLKKGIASLSALLLVCAQFLLQVYLTHNSQGKNFVFESAKEVVDQSFWGARVNKMGLGPEPIPHKRLSADQLAAAIHQAVTDVTMRRRAQAVGETVRSENGLENAVAIVERYFGGP